MKIVLPEQRGENKTMFNLKNVKLSSTRCSRGFVSVHFLQRKFFFFFQINLDATCIKDDLELLTTYFLIFHKKGGALKLFMLESSLVWRCKAFIRLP